MLSATQTWFAAGARLPESAHVSRPWRIHEIAADFRVEDVWALPTPGRSGDFPRLVDLVAGFQERRSSSRALRALVAIRWKLGELLGWDSPESRVPALRDRLPEDLRKAPAGPQSTLPFTPVYMTDDEWVLELANETVHGVLHLGWVPAVGGYRGQMAVLVRPNGRLGAAYMTAIAPFRHLIVYPALMRDLEREWTATGPMSGEAVAPGAV